MTEPKFKVGDRVKGRGYSCGGVDIDGEKGIIEMIACGNGAITVRFLFYHQPLIVKPSQVIKLIPKKRREIWAYEHPEQGLWLTCTPEKEHQTSRVEKSGGKVIRFVEAKEK